MYRLAFHGGAVNLELLHITIGDLFNAESQV